MDTTDEKVVIRPQYEKVKGYKKNSQVHTGFNVNNSVEGETIENKMDRITNNNDPITDGAPIIYTDKKDGVRPEFDIRTDKWEIAIDAMDTAVKSETAKAKLDIVKDENKDDNNDGGAEPIQGTRTE